MKKLAFLALAVVAVAGFSGCMGPMSPVAGMIYMDVKAPLTATGNTKGKKVGKAEAKSYLGMVAMGDASIEAAAKAGGITKVSSVDYESKTILGIISTFTTVVYGE